MFEVKHEWELRKQRIREETAAKLAMGLALDGPTATSPRGPAHGPTAPAVSAKPVAHSGPRDATPMPGTCDTSATVTAPVAALELRQTSSTSAPPTFESFSSSTVWTMSPSGFVETGSVTSIEDLSGLPERERHVLTALAAGRNEPVSAVVHGIAEFFVENESEQAETTLAEAIGFYVANYVNVKALGIG